jgi:serine/threonine protein kinase
MSTSENVQFLIFIASSVAIFANFIALAVLLQRSLLFMVKRVYGAEDNCQAKLEKVNQASVQLIFWAAITCYGLFACKAAFFTGGVGDWLTGWLYATFRDANIIANSAAIHASVPGNDFFSHFLPPVTNAFSAMAIHEYSNMHNFVRSGLALCLIVLPFRLVCRTAAFFTSLCQRISHRFDGTIDSAIVDTLKVREIEVKIFDERPQLMKVLHSLEWLAFCYALLFWLFGFSGGALGATISAFLEFSIRDAWHSNFANINLVRPFLGAVIASYATVPFAIMSSVFLPARKPALLTLNSNSLLFSENFLLPLNFRVYRSMNDISAISLEPHQSDFQRSTLRLSFFSGGIFRSKLKQFERSDLQRMINFIDENASRCTLDANVLALKQKLSEELSPGSEVPEHGSTEFEALESESIVDRRAEFKSTVFVPHAPDTVLHAGSVRIIKQLSSKPTSAVYMARRADGCLCLLKQFIVSPVSLASLTAKEEIHEETTTAVEAKAPGSSRESKIFDKFCIENAAYVLCDYVQGEDLRTFVSRLGASKELEVVSWAIEIAEIMDSLHGQSVPVIHGSLKPSKLILDNSGAIRLLDASRIWQFFDVANTDSNASASRTLVSEQSYIAPEQLRGQVTCQSDIYSFGCTLFYLLTGRHPDALTPADLTNEDIFLTDWFIQLIISCTAFEQDERPKSFQDILLTLKSHQSMPQSLARRRLNDAASTLSDSDNSTANIAAELTTAQTPAGLILKFAACTTDDGSTSELNSKQQARITL